MSKNKLVSLVILIMLFIPQIALAGSSNAETNIQTSQVEFSGARFAVHTDAVAGEKRLRLVAPTPSAVITSGLKGKVIVIDPGHGGTDSGTIGPDNTQEKTVTLAVALKVKKLLEQAGTKVYMTRVDDCDVYAPHDSAADELDARVMVGNKNKADAFIDIHANSFSDPKVGGTTTYYYQESAGSQLLAQNLQDSVIAANGLNDRSVQPADFYVLKRTMMPSSLIELAFLSNPDEEKLLNLPQFQQKLAEGIVNGLASFFIQAARLGVEVNDA